MWHTKWVTIAEYETTYLCNYIILYWAPTLCLHAQVLLVIPATFSSISVTKFPHRKNNITRTATERKKGMIQIWTRQQVKHDPDLHTAWRRVDAGSQVVFSCSHDYTFRKEKRGRQEVQEGSNVGCRRLAPFSRAIAPWRSSLPASRFFSTEPTFTGTID